MNLYHIKQVFTVLYSATTGTPNVSGMNNRVKTEKKYNICILPYLTTIQLRVSIIKTRSYLQSYRLFGF